MGLKGCILDGRQGKCPQVWAEPCPSGPVELAEESWVNPENNSDMMRFVFTGYILATVWRMPGDRL